MIALKNIADCYKFQLSISGGMVPRLTFTTIFWIVYLVAKNVFRQGERSRDWALRLLNFIGLSSVPVHVRLPNGAVLDLHTIITFTVLPEICAGMYAFPDGRDAQGVVYDIGGNQGVYATLAGMDADVVISFEPEPANLALLRKNAAQNDLPIVVQDFGLSDRQGTEQLNIHPFSPDSHSVGAIGPKCRKVAIQVKTIDDVSKTMLDPDLIKIDAEGSTIPALRGAIGTIGRCRPRIVLEIHKPTDIEDAAWILCPFGYEVKVRGNILFGIPRVLA